jgi:hypothetical protein
MSREDRRKAMDPRFVEKLRARLARIRTFRAARQTEELAADWQRIRPNWIEAQILAAKRKDQRR